MSFKKHIYLNMVESLGEKLKFITSKRIYNNLLLIQLELRNNSLHDEIYIKFNSFENNSYIVVCEYIPTTLVTMN